MSGLVFRGEDGALYTLKVLGNGDAAPEIDVYTGASTTPVTTASRTITNASTPFADLAADSTVTFTLVDANGVPQQNVLDTVEQAYVPGRSTTVAIDSNGVFSVPLWPTSRGASPLYYRCEIQSRGLAVLPSVTRPLPLEDESDLSFADWQALDRW